MRSAFLTMTRHGFPRAQLLFGFAALLMLSAASHAEEARFESRTWTDKKGNQLTSTFVEAKNGEVQLKSDAGDIQKFKLADFAEPDQKYLRDLSVYRRKLAAGEQPQQPADPARASLEIQPRQTITDPVPDMAPYRKPLLEFPIRIWTDSTGKKVQGKLVTAYNDKIVIDVKGNVFDLAVTRLSPDDQQYVTVQLKGLQRDDLANVLAKAATAGQQQPGAAPPPPTVAANTPPTTLGTDDIRARLEQLKAQRGGNPDAGTQVAANTPPPQALSTDDIKARLAKLRQQRGEPEPQFTPAASSPADDAMARMNAQAQAAQERMQQQQAEMERRQQEMLASVAPPTPTPAPPRPAPTASSSSSSESSSESGGGFRIRRINIGFLMAVGAAIFGGIARLFGRS